ncbi:MAG: hypothetical protein ABR562_00450 [Thermoplasmatota archaeon]
MAAAAKFVGAILVVVGVILLVAGLAAAAYGLNDANEQRHEVLRNQHREETDQAAMTVGAAAAAGGLVLFLAGLITLVASRSRPVAAPAAPAAARGGKSAAPSPPPSPPDAARRNAALAGTIGFVLVALLVAGIFYFRSGGDPRFFSSSGSGPEVVLNETHDGTVQGFSFGAAGAPAMNFGDNAGDFVVPANATSCTVALDWTPATPGGADALTLQVTRGGETVGTQSGGPGIVLQLAGDGMAGAKHHYTVFPAGNASVVSQGFRLRVGCIGA